MFKSVICQMGKNKRKESEQKDGGLKIMGKGSGIKRNVEDERYAS